MKSLKKTCSLLSGIVAMGWIGLAEAKQDSALQAPLANELAGDYYKFSPDGTSAKTKDGCLEAMMDTNGNGIPDLTYRILNLGKSAQVQFHRQDLRGVISYKYEHEDNPMPQTATLNVGNDQYLLDFARRKMYVPSGPAVLGKNDYQVLPIGLNPEQLKFLVARLDRYLASKRLGNVNESAQAMPTTWTPAEETIRESFRKGLEKHNAAARDAAAELGKSYRNYEEWFLMTSTYAHQLAPLVRKERGNGHER